jgi:hypothetical protein
MYTSFYSVSLYCASQILRFLQIGGLWQPCVEQVYRHHFPTACAHFTSLNHILVILTIFQTFSLLLLLQSIISWTEVLSHHIKRYSHTLTHIHIHPQNNRRWPLCKSANVCIAAGNTAETYLQEGPIRLPL